MATQNKGMARPPLEVDDESNAALLARLRVATITGRLPAEVGRWALDVIEEHLPALELTAARNRHLRAAADLVSGTAWAKASRLRAEIIATRSRNGSREPAPGTVEHHVHEAVRIDPETPTSLRHLLRVVTDTP